LVEFDLIFQLLAIKFQSDSLKVKYDSLADLALEDIDDRNPELNLKFGNVIDSEQTLLASYSSFLNNNDLLINK